MPRLSNIENLSDTFQERSGDKYHDVYDYNVGLYSSADTQLIVSCYTCNPYANLNDTYTKFFNFFYFRIKFDSTNISHELKDILDNIYLNKKIYSISTRFKICTKTKKYLFDYYGGKIRMFGNEVTNVDDIFVQNYEILKMRL